MKERRRRRKKRKKKREETQNRPKWKKKEEEKKRKKKKKNRTAKKKGKKKSQKWSKVAAGTVCGSPFVCLITILSLSDGNRVIVCQTIFLSWVPPSLSYELWKLRIELWKQVNQTPPKWLWSQKIHYDSK